jgi:tRNA (cytidine/uridine-2'-O-)-methyltransferase
MRVKHAKIMVFLVATEPGPEPRSTWQSLVPTRMVDAPTPGPRLRGQTLDIPFQIMLIEPEIPPNTGNIARLCAATGSPLHLVGKLGFSLDEKAVRRAGLDYWHLVEVVVHEDVERALAAAAARGATRCHFLSARATRSYHEVHYQPGDALVFGKESTGLSDEILNAHADQLIGIPTLGAVRSLNLANAVAVTLFEALRQNCVLDGAQLR